MSSREGPYRLPAAPKRPRWVQVGSGVAEHRVPVLWEGVRAVQVTLVPTVRVIDLRPLRNEYPHRDEKGRAIQGKRERMRAVVRRVPMLEAAE